jgi:hypothetical protein
MASLGRLLFWVLMLAAIGSTVVGLIRHFGRSSDQPGAQRPLAPNQPTAPAEPRQPVS